MMCDMRDEMMNKTYSFPGGCLIIEVHEGGSYSVYKFLPHHAWMKMMMKIMMIPVHA